MERRIYDLYTLLTALKKGVESTFPTRVWVRAEISAVKRSQPGHCYLELSQTGESGMIATVKANIWASKYRILGPCFEKVTGMPLQSGITVLLYVQVTYSQVFGLALNVDDIDPAYTLGERERARRETIQRLQEEGLMDMQKRLPAVPLPRRIAVISSGDAAGYGDFMRHLDENPYGFRFAVQLFQAVMQGGGCPDSIMSALEDIALSDTHYDIVLILRGGGSELDLACYDDPTLCAGIARFPIPVWTAIGHERDTHIADMVAALHAKTPTALADTLTDLYAEEDARLSDHASRLILAFNAKINAMENRVTAAAGRIRAGAGARITALESRISVMEARILAADPRKILERGYILALDAKGAALKKARGRAAGDRISLMFPDGTLHCTVDDVILGSSPDPGRTTDK